MSSWRPFRLMEIPQPEYQRSHNETCMPCREAWRLSAFAIHESAHCAVALRLGIPVHFVAIDEHREVEASALEASLYAPLIKRGTPIPALVTRLEPRALRNTPKEVLIAMAAPSCVRTGHPLVDAYSETEATMVAYHAQLRGLDPEAILDEAKAEVTAAEQQILALAEQLAETGWVDSPTLDRGSDGFDG